MKSIANKIMKAIMGVIVALAACYLLLQIGRFWGNQEGFEEGYLYGVLQAKSELKWSIENEDQIFWFGDVRINTVSKRLEVRNDIK